MKVVIVDYGSGNLRSAAKALELVSTEINGQYDITVTGDAAVVGKADYVVLPGVGAFGDCVAGLAQLDGMIDALNEVVAIGGRPFLGICVGMQLMADRGIEHGEHAGLGWISGDVLPIEPVGESLKIPHMGWNELRLTAENHPVLNDIVDRTHAYFVHSFSLRCADEANVLAVTDYGGAVSAVVGRDNMIGTQFHPEKSQAAGLALLKNFLKWQP
ncbi:MAG: imidazole glycerol phosphate synthase subunit HisH [Alphaproteobacteria bacterium]|nr:imidazole glycerol phosphate synthase subunit HisH [Alphaproteobacteria bacterium]